MSVLTDFPKIDPVLPGLCALSLVLRKDYGEGIHDVRFDIVPDESGGDPVLWSPEYRIEIAYLGTNSYRVDADGTEFLGSFNDARIIVSSFYRAKQ